MTDLGETVLEQGKTLSKSRLWELQYSIYDHYGPEVWTEAGVPFYMTSNPYTSRQYAQVTLGYIRDYIRGVRGERLDLSQPLYIFDLGAGTGRFGYLFLRELKKLLAHTVADGIKVCYVMTDMIESNLDYLRHHPYLQEMIHRGEVDFAYYHTSFDKQPLKLQISKRELTADKIVNPITIVGNYFFDVIPFDVFKVVKKTLCEGQVKISCPGKIDVVDPDPRLLKELRTEYSYVPVEKESRYYVDNVQEAILRHYAGIYEGISFSLPVGAFQSLRYFKHLSSNRLLLLAGDQGVCNEQQIRQAPEPKITVQGGISVPVSYNAIAKFFIMQNGSSWLTSYPDTLFVNIAAAFGGGPKDHPETELAFDNTLNSFQPSDYWKLTCCSEQEWKNPSLEYLLLLIKMGNWDPLNFHAFFSSIHKQLPGASESTKQMLIATIEHVWHQFYPVDKAEACFVMNLGVLLFELKKFSEALIFFERSLAIDDTNKLVYRNMAACYAALNLPDEALKCLLKAGQTAGEA